MRRTLVPLIAIALLAALAATASAQYREYHLLGSVVGRDGRPIAGVEIRIRDQVSSRSYSTRTEKSGSFEFVGLPHGVFDATIRKEGYASRSDEWKFEEPQDRMQKVEVPQIVLLTEGQVEGIELDHELQEGVGKAAEKIRAGDFDGALDLLKEMIAKKPEDANALYLAGICYLRKQMAGEAMDAFKKVTAAKPDFAAGHLQLGLSYQKSGDPAGALASYGRVIEIEPQNVVALYNSGVLLDSENRSAEAITYFERAIDIKKDDPAVFETAAYCHLRLGNHAKALEYLERARDLTQDASKIEALDELISQLREKVQK